MGGFGDLTMEKKGVVNNEYVIVQWVYDGIQWVYYMGYFMGYI